MFLRNFTVHKLILFTQSQNRFLFSNVISDVACFKKPDDTDNYYGNATSNKRTANSVLLHFGQFCHSGKQNFMRVGLNNNCILFTIFSTKLYFENLSLRAVFCRICIYLCNLLKEEIVFLQNFTVYPITK